MKRCLLCVFTKFDDVEVDIFLPRKRLRHSRQGSYVKVI